MRGTKLTANERRVATWQRNVGPILLSDAAYDVLAGRLAIRWRAACWSIPIGVSALVPIGFVMAAAGDPHAGTAAWGRRHATEIAAIPILLALALMVCQELTYRWERPLAATLRTRVSRTAAVGLGTVLGRVRMAALGMAAVVDTALAVAGLWVEVWFGAMCLVIVAASLGFVFLGLRRAVTRPTIAADGESLAVDERFRSEDAFVAARTMFVPLLLIPVSALAAGRPAQWFFLGWIISVFALQVLQMLAQYRPPWKASAPRPSSSAVRA